jgi:hypothetical protein
VGFVDDLVAKVESLHETARVTGKQGTKGTPGVTGNNRPLSVPAFQDAPNSSRASQRLPHKRQRPDIPQNL